MKKAKTIAKECSDQEAKEDDNCGAYDSFNTQKNTLIECLGEEAVTPGTFCYKSIQQSPRGFIWDGRWRKLYDVVLRYLREVLTGAVIGATKKMVCIGKNVIVLKMAVMMAKFKDISNFDFNFDFVHSYL
ncbi:uncharacterized protein TNIN_106541 [Trichonephila inaurata madagascariensis]|uniref:Uncharacterized protein n=1 Tax=Trichonephila inaurata madagascariensis TaxID=2747483 RepID=A0A8X7BUW9_9ARAC|nr:uncharacterized protein TNIN_106541 [Trichonephila inaurata madagascariensis]